MFSSLGGLSFTIVDGEPYVKVGADTLRPFKSGASAKIQIRGLSNINMSEFTLSVNIIKDCSIKFETTHYSSNWGYSRIIINDSIVHNCEGNYITNTYTETAEFKEGDILQFTCRCSSGNGGYATFDGYYTIL